jgi:hypothetical protein
VQEAGHLFLAGFDHARIRMAGGSNAEGRRQIQIFLPVGVPDKNIAGALPDDGPGSLSLEEQNIARLIVPQHVEPLTIFVH